MLWLLFPISRKIFTADAVLKTALDGLAKAIKPNKPHGTVIIITK